MALADIRTVPQRTQRLPDWTLPLAGSLLLALALRAPYATIPLGPDEGGVAWVAQQWTTATGSLYGGQWLDRPPLLVALYRLAEPFGPLGIRALGALAALALVVAAFAVGTRLGGPRAGRVAGLLAALGSSSIALEAVFAPAELLAAVPSLLSVGALIAAHRSGRLRWLAVAGALAVAALLIKQSFLDAGLAGTAYLVARTVAGAPRRPAAWAAYAASVTAAVLPVGVWALVAHVDVRMLLDALFGFRAQSLGVLQGGEAPLWVRARALALPALGSLLVVLVPLALLGVGRLWQRDRVLAVALAAWLAGGAVGVLAGGSYWPHYLIQLVAPAALGAALVLGAARRRTRRTLLTVAAVVAIVVSTAGGAAAVAHPWRTDDTQVARYVREHARPGDSFYALYARANLNYAVGLPTPFPYSWSLMVRAKPGARHELLALLRSSRRPTWVVEWQRPYAWNLDPGARIATALRRHYRVVHRVGDRLVLRATG